MINFLQPNDLHQPPRRKCSNKKTGTECGRMNAFVRRFLADKVVDIPGLTYSTKAIESDPNTATLRELIVYKQVVKDNTRSLNHGE